MTKPTKTAAVATKAEKTKTSRVKFGGSAETGHQVEIPRSDSICKIFATDDDMQANALLSHCLKVLKKDEASADFPHNDERVFMLSIVRDIAPRDAVERMLAVQMAAVHVATVRSARWLANAETIPQVQVHYSGVNKLARTFAAQIEALKRHRSKGQQVVRVERVTVESGAQAVVGNVSHGGRPSDEDGR